MKNIPSNDPGLVLVPGDLQVFCEWLVRRAGEIATCVESAEMMVNHVIGGLPVSPAQDNWLADDLLKRGQAAANGATNGQAASQQMARLGVSNTYYGWDWFQAGHDWIGTIKDSLNRGMPVLFGVYAAHNLRDDWTGQAKDAGVDGHGICLFGYDATGFIVGDPNTPEASRGDFVHYRYDTLKQAWGAYPSMCVPQGTRSTTPMPITLDHDASGAVSGAHETDHPELSVGAGMARQIEASGWLAATITVPELHDLPEGVTVAVLRDKARVVLTYSPAHGVQTRNDDVVEAVQDLYSQRESARAQVAALSQQVAQLQAQTQLSAEAKDALGAAEAVLAPFAAAEAKVKAVLS